MWHHPYCLCCEGQDRFLWQRRSKLINKALKKKCIPIKQMQILLGKLQHASMGIPGGSGLFSALQMACKGTPDTICMTKLVKEALQDWKQIIRMMKKLQHQSNNLSKIIHHSLDTLTHATLAQVKSGCQGQRECNL